METLQSPSLSDWRIIDGIGPFFRSVRTKRVNWSKVPFADWERNGQPCPARIAQVMSDSRRFAACVADEGYNAITFDDLAHLSQWDGYPAELRDKIDRYRELYADLFRIARAQGLRPLLTTDVVPCATQCREPIDPTATVAIDWLAESVDRGLSDFPELAGMILRIGECDEARTRGDFRSRLTIRTPRQARRLLQTLLPVFERHRRTLFFRLWTVGAYPIGDLLWHPRTFGRVFHGIDSPWLCLSLKPGESDFFRYLTVNAHFFRSRHRKIVEFQARREYEGFGEYPGFAGVQAAEVLAALSGAPNLCGISVWCQTGGWGRFKRLTYLRDSSPWVELNVSVLGALARGETWRNAASCWLKRHAPEADPTAFPEFLLRLQRVIDHLLYLRCFAEQPLYFRRVRIPPLLYVYWDRILVLSPLRCLLRHWISPADRARAIREGEDAFVELETLETQARDHGFPSQGLAFQRDTFEILLAVRAYYLNDAPEAALMHIRRLKKQYKQRWRPRYAIRIQVAEPTRSARRLIALMPLLCRRTPRYRLVDRLLFLRPLGWVHGWMRRFNPKWVPRFARKRAMGIDSLFR